MYHIVILKTKMTIPYTSVFLQLDCKYWSADQEKQMREKMRAAQ
jgi:predicted nucleic acid-binding protein